MKKHVLLLILFVVGIVGLSHAQTPINEKQHNANWCGSSLQDNLLIKERMIKNRTEMANWVDTRTAILWVPIRFHIVTNDSGGDHVRELNVFDMLCEINEDYLDQEIQFFIKDSEFNYIQSTTANTNPRSFAGDFQLSANKVNNALNVFIVKTIPNFGGGGGNTLGYFDPSSDWIVLQRDQVSGPAAETFTHELGHFFSLPHPFLGWDGDYWDDSFGIPVGPLSPGGVPNEYVNGSNCMTAGDGICDTGANYGLGFGWSSCNYTGPCQDPNGELLSTVVQEENFMAYFIGCGSEFTPDQKALINMDLNSPQRAYLGAGNVTPTTDAITAAPNALMPIGGEVSPFYNVVEFDWDNVPGATHYLIEVDRTNTFSFDPQAQIVTSSYAVFEDIFDDNRNYYWRIKGINLGNTCGPVTSVLTFKTGTEIGMVNVDEIVEVKEWKVSPNPLNSDQLLNVQVIADQSFDADVKIYNANGQLLQSQAHTFGVGTSNFELSVENLSAGLYMLFIESENGVLNEKIVVTR